MSARRKGYVDNPDRKKATSRAYSKRSYSIAPDRKKATSHAYSKISYAKNHRAKSKSFKKYYAKHKESMRANRRARYALAERKPDVEELYLKAMVAHMLHDFEARSELTKAFKKQHAIVAKRVSRALGRTACRIAAKRLCNQALQMRKEQAGSLLQSTRAIKSIQIKGSEDLGRGCHTASSEPYFYDSAYQPVKRLCHTR